MQLFQITVPLADNQGRPMQEAHGLFARAILKTAGGYTHADAWGEHDAPPYVGGEAVRVYTFATDATSKARRVVDHARTYFPDQASFFVSRIGDAALARGVGAEPPMTWEDEAPPLPVPQAWETALARARAI